MGTLLSGAELEILLKIFGVVNSSFSTSSVENLRFESDLQNRMGSKLENRIVKIFWIGYLPVALRTQ